MLSFSEVQCKFQDSFLLGCGAASLGDGARRFEKSNAFILKGQMKQEFLLVNLTVDGEHDPSK
jgi:hypothetical protein